MDTLGGGKQKGEVTLAKEAAASLRAWLDADDSTHFGQHEKDIELVLRHYAKLTKPKVCRKGRYVKGRSFEYEVRDYFIGRGLACRRVTQSGGGVEKDDLVLTTGFGDEYRLELKRVAKLPAYLVNSTVATIFREDRGATYVLTQLPHYADLLQ